jgi:hypothetical protein
LRPATRHTQQRGGYHHVEQILPEDRRAILAMFAAMLTASLPAQACTSFLLRASDGTPIYGRTMEFGFQLSSEMIVIPRQFGLSATGPDGKVGGGMPWQTKYAAVGLNAFDMPVLTDGMNEKGSPAASSTSRLCRLRRPQDPRTPRRQWRRGIF